ncbi:MAG TPA: hypothetical protein VHJ17_06510 [Thermomonospora sp.]|nr:hypothetical protein [Thermomonospora sp.]
MSGYGDPPGGEWAAPHGYGGGQDHGTPQGWNAYGPYPQAGHPQAGHPHPGHVQPGHDYGYGPPGVPVGGGDNSSAVVALVCNIVATLICCNVLCIGGIVTSAIALSRARTDPAESRNLTMWSWAILGVSLALEIVLFAILIMAGALSEDSTSSGGYGSV